MALHRLSDSYSFPGFKPNERISGVLGDSKACIVRLERTGKKLSAAAVARSTTVSTIEKQNVSAIFPVATNAYISSLNRGVSTAWSAAA